MAKNSGKRYVFHGFGAALLNVFTGDVKCPTFMGLLFSFAFSFWFAGDLYRLLLHLSYGSEV